MSYKNRANFKPLSEFIKRVNIKNKDGKVSELKGINIDKFFMPSVANVVGTDLTRYKVVKPQQFACNRMHVGRDYRLPIAVSRFDNNIIVSPAYDVFEIIDTNKLNPEYLMMWFSRSEFDRNCWFYTDTDVRGKLGWDSFCEIELPIPSIEKQNEIVKEYNIVINRIKLNEQLNQKLEETAQALYKHWFVDFEFPNAVGKPYKSSGGEMVFNEELDREIPAGWEVTSTDEYSEILFGYSFDSKLFSNNTLEKPLVRIRDIISNKAETYTSETVDEKYIIKPQDMLIGMDGKFHCRIWFGNESYLNQRVVRLRENSNISIYKIFFSIREELVELQDSIFGTTVSHLSNGNVRNLKLIVSPLDKKYQLISKSILDRQIKLFSENLKLKELKELLLSKMTKIEVEKEIAS